MNWRKALGDLAPTIGAAFSPLGAAGGLLVKQLLGVPDASDDELISYLQTPEGSQKIRQAEYDYNNKQKELDIQQTAQDAEIIKSVNESIRAESQSEHWLQWSWRPLWGVISAAAFGFVCVLVCIMAYKAVLEKDASSMTMIPQFITSITMLFSVPGAILGITSFGRNKLKLEREKL